MKVQCGLMVIVAIVTLGHANPLQPYAPEPSDDLTDGTGRPLEDTVSTLTKEKPASPVLGEDPESTGSRQFVPSVDKTTASGSERTDVVDNFVSSLPSWADGAVFDGNSVDVDGGADEMYDEDELLAEIEARLVAGKLETLYQSISHLKFLLYNIREKAIGDLGRIRAETSYLSGDAPYAPLAEVEDGDDNKATDDNKPDASSTRVNYTDSNGNPQNKAVESSMAETQTKTGDSEVLDEGRRFKRDLGLNLGKLNRGRFTQSDAGSYSSYTEENAPSYSAWGMFSSAAEDNQLQQEEYNQELRWKSREGEDGRHALDDWDKLMDAYLNRLERRRRNKEDLHTFLQNMPTLEGMRKRRNYESGPPENQPVIPDPGPLFPAPPNLPPPGNIIHPILPPDETLAWQPSPDFEEDNALLEEQTNGLDLTNPGMINRLEYLKSLERSVLMEPLEDLAIELAGGHPMLPQALRVRRVMQIPPPPPYGRKVVKSLYRKKAYGFPFVDSAYEELSDPDAAVAAERQWEDHLPFGRTRSSDAFGDQKTKLIDQLLTSLAKKEAKDRLLSRLMSLEDVPPNLQRKILFEALEEEADIGVEESESAPEESFLRYETQDSESNASLQWVSFDPAGEDDNDIGPNDSLDMVSEGGSSDRGNALSQGDSDGAGYPSEGSQSEAMVPTWGGTKEEPHSNVSPPINNPREQLLINRLALILHRPETNHL